MVLSYKSLQTINPTKGILLLEFYGKSYFEDKGFIIVSLVLEESIIERG